MRDRVRFLLDGKLIELLNPDPGMTVLNLLRRDLRRTGTKEGCAEGDCGACTVVVGEPADGDVRYRAINACIAFVPMLDGKALFTVESLRGEGGLHPAQQALVEHHGSQCGFCTPGFVMSLFALYQRGGRPDRAAVEDTLSGNLCRCTGYRPILDAAQAMADLPAPTEAPIEAAALACFAGDGTLDVAANGRRWLAPRTLEQLDAAAAAFPEATFVAGATDVGLWVTKRHRSLPVVIDVSRVPALSAIRETDEGLSIGAAVRYADAAGPLTALYPAMAGLLRRLGSVQVRNSGTVGGNVANGSPIGDMSPALIAAGATLVLRGRGGVRRLPIEDYFLAYGVQDRRPGEYLAEIVLPAPPAGRILSLHKVSKRFDQDISAVFGAFALDVADGVVTAARIAFGGMGPTPARARACEAALIGRAPTESTFRAAAAALDQDFRPISDVRASARYRADVAGNLLLRVAAELAQPQPSVAHG